MRIVLVHPTGSNWVPGKKDITATANRMPPLGLLCIAAYLEKHGHRVFVHDCLGPEAPADNNANAQIITALSPDLIGFSVTTSAFPDGYDLAMRIKKQMPPVKIVFGGVHVSSMGEILLRDYPGIDYLCMGEGEGVMLDLAEGVSVDKIDGLIYRQDARAISNRMRENIKDLDTLPFPAYEKLSGFPKKYRLPLFSYIFTPGATMITSRGCPYQCSYCDRSVFKRSYRYNSAEYVYEHIKYLNQRFGVRHINIYDDLFTTHRKRVLKLCEMLISKPLGMNFNCAVRVGHADDELLKMLKAAGFLMLSVGIETGDSDLMEIHKPGVTVEEVKDTIRRIQSHGLRAKGLFMMGLPGDTPETIKKTSDFVMSLDLDDMNMSKFTPFYGAPVWSTIFDEGHFDYDWKKMNCLNFVFIPRGIDSKETLDQLYNLHVKRFYSSRQWRKKFIKRWWEHRHSLLYLLSNLPIFLAAMRNFEPDH